MGSTKSPCCGVSATANSLSRESMARGGAGSPRRAILARAATYISSYIYIYIYIYTYIQYTYIAREARLVWAQRYRLGAWSRSRRLCVATAGVPSAPSSRCQLEVPAHEALLYAH